MEKKLLVKELGYEVDKQMAVALFGIDYSRPLSVNKSLKSLSVLDQLKPLIRVVHKNIYVELYMVHKIDGQVSPRVKLFYVNDRDEIIRLSVSDLYSNNDKFHYKEEDDFLVAYRAGSYMNSSVEIDVSNNGDMDIKVEDPKDLPIYLNDLCLKFEEYAVEALYYCLLRDGFKLTDLKESSEGLAKEVSEFAKEKMEIYEAGYDLVDGFINKNYIRKIISDKIIEKSMEVSVLEDNSVQLIGQYNPLEFIKNVNELPDDLTDMLAGMDLIFVPVKDSCYDASDNKRFLKIDAVDEYGLHYPDLTDSRLRGLYAAMVDFRLDDLGKSLSKDKRDELIANMFHVATEITYALFDIMGSIRIEK